MQKYNKRHYPAIAEIDVDLDYELIENFMLKHYDRWQDNMTAHKGLAVASNQIADQTYNAVQHFHLTECNKNEPLETAQAYSTKDKLKRKIPYSMDEHNWDEPVDFYKGTELQSHLNSAFQGKLIRVRYSRMFPGGVVPKHIDYNTTYAMRFIIPLSGNKGVTNTFWYNGDEIKVEMQCKRCYFLNIGYPHSVIHEGMGIRHYLMGSVAGNQKDFECIRFITDNN